MRAHTHSVTQITSTDNSNNNNNNITTHIQSKPINELLYTYHLPNLMLLHYHFEYYQARLHLLKMFPRGRSFSFYFWKMINFHFQVVHILQNFVYVLLQKMITGIQLMIHHYYFGFHNL